MPTQRQLDTLATIARLIQERRYSPSVEEIRIALGLDSLSATHALLSRLIRHRLIVRQPNKARTILLTARAYMLV